MRRFATVDKRIAGIVRWLERLKSSYSQGAMEIALMDAECARADLENLRQDVFTKCAHVHSSGERTFTKIFAAALRVVFLAMLIVMASVMPISRENVPAPILTETSKVVLAEPIKIIRENKDPAKPAPRRVKRQPVKPVERAAKPVQAPAVNKKVSYEQVLSLMQTGQRALKDSSTVVIK